MYTVSCFQTVLSLNIKFWFEIDDAGQKLWHHHHAVINHDDNLTNPTTFHVRDNDFKPESFVLLKADTTKVLLYLFFILQMHKVTVIKTSNKSVFT